MSFQNPSLSLSNGAEVISGFIRSVGQSVARKVSRRHSMGHYDRLHDPVIPRSFNTMSNLPATPEKVEVNEKPIRTPSVTSVRTVTLFRASKDFSSASHLFQSSILFIFHRSN